MQPGIKNAATVTAGVVFVVLVAFVIYATTDTEPAPSATEPDGHDAPSASEAQVRRPLPAQMQRLEPLVAFARERAKRWRTDARLTRLYATQITPQGAFDRDASEVQIVFVSPEASQARTQVNGWRLSVQGGKFGEQEIWQHPAPEPDSRPFRWCALDALLGQDAPERFTLDVQYATRGRREPVMLMFTRQPMRWLVGADPHTCRVHERSRPRTEEEQAAKEASTDAGGAFFDAREAMRQLEAAADASACRKGAPSGRATVQVTFSKNGEAQRVEFLAGPYAGTAAGRCLEQALKGLRIAPWERGDGRAAARFEW